MFIESVHLREWMISEWMNACYTAGWCGWGSHHWWTAKEFKCKRPETAPMRKTKVWFIWLASDISDCVHTNSNEPTLQGSVQMRKTKLVWMPPQRDYVESLATGGSVEQYLLKLCTCFRTHLHDTTHISATAFTSITRKAALCKQRQEGKKRSASLHSYM